VAARVQHAPKRRARRLRGKRLHGRGQQFLGFLLKAHALGLLLQAHARRHHGGRPHRRRRHHRPPYRRFTHCCVWTEARGRTCTTHHLRLSPPGAGERHGTTRTARTAHFWRTCLLAPSWTADAMDMMDEILRRNAAIDAKVRAATSAADAVLAPPVRAPTPDSLATTHALTAGGHRTHGTHTLYGAHARALWASRSSPVCSGE
jgi:hypothetical protein